MRGALAVALLAWSPAALAAEYRAFTLTDGRSFVAEVLATEATGMRVRLPAGEVAVPFGDLVDMVPADEAAYLGQEPLLVYVAADGPYRSGFQASYRSRPGLSLVGEDDAVLTGDERRAAAICAADLACVVDALDDNPRWMWVVSGRMEGLDAVFEGAVTKGPTRTRATAPRTDVVAVDAAAWQAIGLLPPVSATPVAVAPEPRTRPPRAPRERGDLSPDRLVALSFVPVPGYPAAVAGDWTGFGMGLAVAVPTTVVWLGATGKSAQSPAGHVLMGLGGYYAATVVTNQVLSATRLRDAGVAVGVGPTEHGGGALSVTIAR